MPWDGHELAVLGTLSGVYGVTQGIYGKGWMKSLIHRQPIAAMSLALCGMGLLLPMTVVPMRRAMGLPTNQYDASHPKAVYPKLA